MKSKRRAILFIGLLSILLFSANVFAETNTQKSEYLFTKNHLYVYQKDGLLRKLVSVNKKNRSFGYDDLYNTKFENVTSSKPSVASVKATYTPADGETYDYSSFYYNVKKPGTAVIKYDRLNTFEGTKESVEETIKVHKYQNPIKKLRIGKKNFASKFNQEPYYKYNKTISGKISVTPKAGWKVKKMRIVQDDYFPNYDYGVKAVKNHKTITMKKNKGKVLELVMYNKKTKKNMVLAFGNLALYNLQSYENDYYD